jgi:hypothetical protein
MGKLSFIAGLGVGYLLGARAGRKRYEQIKAQATRVWASPPVQARVGEASQFVKAQGAPFVMDKMGDAVKSAGAVLKGRREGEHLPESLHRGTDGHLPPDRTGYGPGPLP